MRRKNKYKISKQDLNFYIQISKEFELNQKIKNIYEEFPDQMRENRLATYGKIASKEYLEEKDLRLHKLVTKIIDLQDSYADKINLDQLLYYMFSIYSELEQGPLGLNHKFTKEVLLTLQTYSLTVNKEIGRKKITKIRKDLLENFPRKIHKLVFNKALNLSLNFGLAVALSYLKYVEKKGLLEPEIEIIRRESAVWIKFDTYTTSQQILKRLTGPSWDKYKKLIQTKSLVQEKVEAKISRGHIYLALPRTIDTQDKLRSILSESWKQVIQLQNQLAPKGPKVKRAPRDYAKTYRMHLLNRRKHSIGEITQEIYQEHESAPIVRHILNKNTKNRS